MADQVEVFLPKTVFNERASFTATARFRDRATATASVPTTAEYKLYNLSTCEIVKDWTTLTPAASVSISITSQDNVLQNSDHLYERMEIIVAADRGQSTQVLDTIRYRLINLPGVI